MCRKLFPGKGESQACVHFNIVNVGEMVVFFKEQINVRSEGGATHNPSPTQSSSSTTSFPNKMLHMSWQRGILGVPLQNRTFRGPTVNEI